MTNPADTNTVAPQEAKQDEKEHNFYNLRKQVEAERSAREAAEARIRELEEGQRRQKVDDDDFDSDEPYIDKKVLKKSLSKIKEEGREETKNVVQREVQRALQQERQNQWMRSNPDFYDVMQHAQKFADLDPELAETILQMPEGFERQKLVYKNIKALGLHKPPEAKPTIQDKIEQNRRAPFYQPSGVGSAPYASTGDFSPNGQKSAYEKMKELQKNLRI